MNRESESLEAYLRHWLLGESDSQGPATGSPVPTEAVGREDLSTTPSTFQEPVVYPEVMELNTNPRVRAASPQESRAESSNQRGAIDSELESYRRSSGYPPLVTRGIPAVQDRFQALLKRRLKQEILRHPPLFPWETQVMDYESDVEVGLDRPRERRLVHAWMAQLRDLPLPIPMGEPVLAQLLEQCQTVAQSSLQTGAKLVRAVEDLFPGQFLTLNQLTELVLMSPARGPQAMLGQSSGQPLPASYEQADPQQQMLLSLLAARELLAALTLVLPADRQPLERTWQTAMGPVELRITTDTEAGTPCLRVQTQLPCGGRVQLTGEAGQTTAQRSLAGPLTVVLQAVGFDQPYTLTLELADGSAATPPSALTFTLRADQPLS